MILYIFFLLGYALYIYNKMILVINITNKTAIDNLILKFACQYIFFLLKIICIFIKIQPVPLVY